MIFPKIWIICRVCLKQQDELFDLFDDTIHNNIWTLLRDCSGLPVNKNDCLPDKICELCLTRLWKAVNFRIDCQRSHRELLQKQMEYDAFLYEEENGAELLKISDIPDSKNVKGEQQLSTHIPEDKENTLAEANNDISTADVTDSSSQNMKQYCIVRKNSRGEMDSEYDTESQSKEPIVLLLRLQNLPHENSQGETSDFKSLNTDINVTAEIKKRRKTLTETINKEVVLNNDNKQLGRKQAKVEATIPAKRNKKERQTKFPCHICKRICRTSELLRHHLYIHKKPYECQICHKQFSQGHSFLSHNNYHTGIKPYYCRICFETFADISNRNAHERLRHKEQQFKCNSCNKSFRFLSLLQNHCNSHKLKKCLICNKDFSSVRLVREHHKRKHLKLLNL